MRGTTAQVAELSTALCTDGGGEVLLEERSCLESVELKCCQVVGAIMIGMKDRNKSTSAAGFCPSSP